jgi:hypothetical protein
MHLKASSTRLVSGNYPRLARPLTGSLDPDIRMDGNPADDCNRNNDVWPNVPATHAKYTIPCIKAKA